MNNKLTLLTAGLFALAGTAQATELNYDYIEAGYSVVDFDDIDEDLSGIFIAGSVLVSDQVFLFGSYTDGQTDRFTLFGDRGRIGVSGYTLGIGLRAPLAPQTDLNVGAAFERAKVEGRSGFSYLGSDSDNGYSLALGLRHLVAPTFELAADVTYIDISEDDTVLTLGGVWHVSELVGVGLGYFVGSDASGWEARVRFKF